MQKSGLKIDEIAKIINIDVKEIKEIISEVVDKE